MAKISYKSLYQYVNEAISKKITSTSNSSGSSSINSSVRISNTIGSSSSDVSLSELVTSIQNMLSDTIAPNIIEGLEVTATEPISNSVKINSGSGTVGGVLYTLDEPYILNINFDSNTSVYYIVLYRDTIQLSKTYFPNKLTIAKIVVPDPENTLYIQDTKDDSINAYIVNFKEYKLYGYNDKFEEDTIELLRDNIGDVLADNLIGNIRLSENLKITNTQGTLELDSNSLKLYDIDENLLAKFNQKGVYFYNTDGIELARFTNIDARVANIIIESGSIHSENFISGALGSGFKIFDSGDAEFNNIYSRGKFSTSVFEKDTISSVGGNLLVCDSDILDSDMTASDDSSLTISGDTSFSVGDLLRIKDGVDDEWLEVTDISYAPTYIVTRDKKETYSSGNNPKWKKGTAVINYGQINEGLVFITASENNSPYIDISINTSTPWNGNTTKVRLGNLSGITDTDFGGALSGYGLYSENVYLKGELYASTICSSDLYGTTITGSTIQTSTTNPKTVFDSYSIKSYDESGNLMTEIKDGNITTSDICLVSATCCCNYSYLSSGMWYFHDELGNSYPYVKRICTLEANTGDTIILTGWTSEPKIMVGIKELYSYNSDYSVNCQKWCIYYDNLQSYVNSGGEFGYCFDVHAKLIKSSGAYAECIYDVVEESSIFTHGDACTTVVRSAFQSWCYNSTCSNCYAYGVVSYTIKYKCCIEGCAWTCCDFTYTQPHSTLNSMKTTTYCCQCIIFGSAGCWEIQQVTSSVAWTLTEFSGLEYCCCCRIISNCSNCSEAWWIGTGNCLVCDSDTVNLAISGTDPSNVYCVYSCTCWCATSLHFYHSQGGLLNRICFGNSIIMCYRICDAGNYTQDEDYTACMGSSSCCVDLSSCYLCVFSSFNFYSCACAYIFGTSWGCAYLRNSTCFQGGYLVQCYCYIPSCCCYMYKHLYSLKDYSISDEVLDPSGILNVLAISYS